MSRGRGRGGSSRGLGNIEALGIKSRDAIPPPLLHPPPLFPPLERKPLELRDDDTTRNILAFKQDYQRQIQESPFNIRSSRDHAHGQQNDAVVRYSDRYRTSSSNDLTMLLSCIPNWKAFIPKELHFVQRKSVGIKQKTTRDIVHGSVKNGRHTNQISDRLKQLEEKEGMSQQVESEGEDEGNKTEDEMYDEEIEEEEGDYQQTYFDPGDEFGVDEDDALDDGPSY